MRCKLDAGVNARVGGRDVTIARDETGCQGANDIMHRKHAEVLGNLKKVKS